MIDSSYGIVPMRRQGDIWMVLLIQHGKAHYWGFPKGHAEAGESPQKAAIRELKEETNLDLVSFFSDIAFKEAYDFLLKGERVHKTVWYFVAEVKGELRLQQEEVSDSKWVPLAEALDHLTYSTDKTILTHAMTLL